MSSGSCTANASSDDELGDGTEGDEDVLKTLMPFSKLGERPSSCALPLPLGCRGEKMQGVFERMQRRHGWRSPLSEGSHLIFSALQVSQACICLGLPMERSMVVLRGCDVGRGQTLDVEPRQAPASNI